MECFVHFFAPQYKTDTGMSPAKGHEVDQGLEESGRRDGESELALLWRREASGSGEGDC